MLLLLRLPASALGTTAARKWVEDNLTEPMLMDPFCTAEERLTSCPQGLLMDVIEVSPFESLGFPLAFPS